jgi:GNAT superfamily N-acetyltransferase
MIGTRQTLFEDLLRNERGFHLLFCDLIKYDYFSLYQNKEFAEDPIFNHFVIEERVLHGKAPIDPSKLKLVIQSAKSAAQDLNLRTSIFVENFWARASQFEKVAVDLGYRITDKMEILTKSLDGRVPSAKGPFQFEVSFTDDIDTWTDVFMSSYSIPSSWREELLRREKAILQVKNAKFVLASSATRPVGCLLTFIEPERCLGIYCVGTIPEQRGRGIARQMLSFSEATALNAGCILLTLQTLTSDHVAPMYKKIGYKTEFERDILWTPLMP